MWRREGIIGPGRNAPERSGGGYRQFGEYDRVGKSTIRDTTHTNITFLHKDARTLQFENQFDVAFSNAVLHWIKDHVPMLESVKKSLKKSGRILFQMGGKGNAQDIVEIAHELKQQKRWRPNFEGFSFPYGFYGPEEYEQWLEQVGLERKRLDLVPKKMSQAG